MNNTERIEALEKKLTAAMKRLTANEDATGTLVATHGQANDELHAKIGQMVTVQDNNAKTFEDRIADVQAGVHELGTVVDLLPGSAEFERLTRLVDDLKGTAGSQASSSGGGSRRPMKPAVKKAMEATKKRIAVREKARAAAKKR